MLMAANPEPRDSERGRGGIEFSTGVEKAVENKAFLLSQA
jgi:hypothetical protein